MTLTLSSYIFHCLMFSLVTSSRWSFFPLPRRWDLSFSDHVISRCISLVSLMVVSCLCFSIFDGLLLIYSKYIRDPHSDISRHHILGRYYEILVPVARQRPPI